MTFLLPLPLALLATFTSLSFVCVCVCFSLLLHALPSKHAVFFLLALSFSHELHIHLHTPLLHLTSFSFFQLVFFLFFEEGGTVVTPMHV